MKVVICNFHQAQEFVPTEPTLAIRIFDPTCVHHSECQKDRSPSRHPEHNVAHPLKPSPNWVGELHYEFHDVDPARAMLEGNTEEVANRLANPDLPSLELELALKMRAEFTDLLYHKRPTTILCHCWAGLSRSVATVKGLCDYMALPIEWQSFDGRHELMKLGHMGNLWLYKMIRSGNTDFRVGN